MNRININFEFTCLKSLVAALWNGTDTDACQNAMRAAFQEGLTDGKLWIDPHFSFVVSKLLNGNNEIELPLANRREQVVEGDDGAYLYDSLYIFDSALTYGVSQIHSSITGHKRWYFSDRADALCERLILEFGELKVSPKDIDTALAKGFVSDYPGCAGGEAGSYSTPDKFLKGFAEYNRDEQGLSLVRTFLSNIFSHGLYIAKEFNTRNLAVDIYPFYAKRNEELNFDNGSEILVATIHNPFVALTNLIRPIVFSSSAEYHAALEQSRANANKVPMTEGEMMRFTERLLKKIKAEEGEMEIRVNKIVDEFTSTFTGQVLEASS